AESRPATVEVAALNYGRPRSPWQRPPEVQRERERRNGGRPGQWERGPAAAGEDAEPGSHRDDRRRAAGAPDRLRNLRPQRPEDRPAARPPTAQRAGRLVHRPLAAGPGD